MKMYSNSINNEKGLAKDFSRIRKNSQKSKDAGKTVTPFKNFTSTLK